MLYVIEFKEINNYLHTSVCYSFLLFRVYQKKNHLEKTLNIMMFFFKQLMT